MVLAGAGASQLANVDSHPPPPASSVRARPPFLLIHAPLGISNLVRPPAGTAALPGSLAAAHPHPHPRRADHLRISLEPPGGDEGGEEQDLSPAWSR